MCFVCEEYSTHLWHAGWFVFPLSQFLCCYQYTSSLLQISWAGLFIPEQWRKTEALTLKKGHQLHNKCDNTTKDGQDIGNTPYSLTPFIVTMSFRTPSRESPGLGFTMDVMWNRLFVYQWFEKLINMPINLVEKLFEQRKVVLTRFTLYSFSVLKPKRGSSWQWGAKGYGNWSLYCQH